MHPEQYRLPFNHTLKGLTCPAVATVRSCWYNSYEQANSIKKMPASNKQTTLWDCGYPQVGCYTLHGSLTSPYKAGFLTSGSSLAFPFSYYVQWDNEGSLLCYSDRIAQDSHLIPSSDCYAETASTSYVLYGIILTL